tara:strand:+ start:380 stop:1138 length:759 start_codon:yes stop_codon:yes gene_type:complete
MDNSIDININKNLKKLASTPDGIMEIHDIIGTDIKSYDDKVLLCKRMERSGLVEIDRETIKIGSMGTAVLSEGDWLSCLKRSPYMKINYEWEERQEAEWDLERLIFKIAIEHPEAEIFGKTSQSIAINKRIKKQEEKDEIRKRDKEKAEKKLNYDNTYNFRNSKNKKSIRKSLDIAEGENLNLELKNEKENHSKGSNKISKIIISFLVLAFISLFWGLPNYLDGGSFFGGIIVNLILGSIFLFIGIVVFAEK